MEFFKKNITINFVNAKARKFNGYLSILLSILSLIGLWSQGLNLSLEFTGGVSVRVTLAQDLTINEINKRLQPYLKDVRSQFVSSTKEILIRSSQLKNVNHNSSDNTLLIKQHINTAFNSALKEIQQIEFVGSEVSNDLFEKGIVAILLSLLATTIYIAYRFERRFGISAIIGLLHDILIILGVFSWFKIKFDLATLAAILAVLGYSLNDTIVVFDRIRENFRKIRDKSTEYILNISIQQTLSRTIMTSLLTLLVVIALLLFAGDDLQGFAIALFIGILIGTYSSIYIASSVALLLKLNYTHMLPTHARHMNTDK